MARRTLMVPERRTYLCIVVSMMTGRALGNGAAYPYGAGMTGVPCVVRPGMTGRALRTGEDTISI